jgi:hypothetical protein
MNRHAKGNAMRAVERGMPMLVPTTRSSTWTTAVTMRVTTTRSLASSKLPKEYRPLYRAKEKPTTSWAATATRDTSSSPGALMNWSSIS